MSLDAHFEGFGRFVNEANPEDHVKIVFTDPPENATDVVLKVIEMAEPGEQYGERKVLTHWGKIINKEFIVAQTEYYYTAKDGKRSPKIWIEAGKHPSYDWHLTLPDDREEGGRFDLKIEVEGKVNGKKEIFKGKVALHLSYPIDVMIIPCENDIYDTEHHALRLIRTWARQWRAYAPATRSIVEMNVDKFPIDRTVVDADYRDFLKAFETAARKSRGGIIALAIGHGSGLQDSGWINLVPEDRPNNTYKGRLFIDETILKFGLTAAPGEIVRNPSDEDQVKLNALSHLGEILDSIYPKVSELRLQTCRTGANRLFRGMLADRVLVPVSGHTDYIEYNPDPVYCHYSEDDSGYETDENLHEWLVKKLASLVQPRSSDPQRQPPRDFRH